MRWFVKRAASRLSPQILSEGTKMGSGTCSPNYDTVVTNAPFKHPTRDLFGDMRGLHTVV